jgi:hypothetical protein
MKILHSDLDFVMNNSDKLGILMTQVYSPPPFFSMFDLTLVMGAYGIGDQMQAVNENFS